MPVGVLKDELFEKVVVTAGRQGSSEDGDELKVFVSADAGSMNVATRIDMDVAGFNLLPFAVD